MVLTWCLLSLLVNFFLVVCGVECECGVWRLCERRELRGRKKVCK